MELIVDLRSQRTATRFAKCGGPNVLPKNVVSGHPTIQKRLQVLPQSYL